MEIISLPITASKKGIWNAKTVFPREDAIAKPTGIAVDIKQHSSVLLEPGLRRTPCGRPEFH